MTTEEGLPAPPYPATLTLRSRGKDVTLPLRPEDVDVRHFGRMPMDVGRLLGSDFYMRANDRAFKAGVTLWCRVWHQVPAGSAPDDERSLAHLAGFGGDVRAWKKVAQTVLDGFVRCSDGRLYHPVICEIALGAYRTSRKQAANAQLSQDAENVEDHSSHGSGHSPGSGDSDGPDLAKPRGEGRGIEGSKSNKKPSSVRASADGSGKPSPGTRGSRIPDDFEPDADVLAWAATGTFTSVSVEAVRAEFVDYWKSVPGAKGRKVDWQATFRNRLREVGPAKAARLAAGDSRGPGQASLFGGAKVPGVHPNSDRNSFRFALEGFAKSGRWNEVVTRSPPPNDPQCRGHWDHPDLMAEFGYGQPRQASGG